MTEISDPRWGSTYSPPTLPTLRSRPTMHDTPAPTRRNLLAGVLAAPIVAALPAHPRLATDHEVASAMREMAGAPLTMSQVLRIRAILAEVTA